MQISETMDNQLEEIKELTDAPSKASVLRDAIYIYSSIIRHVGEGYKIIAKKKNKKKEKIIEFCLNLIPPE